MMKVVLTILAVLAVIAIFVGTVFAGGFIWMICLGALSRIFGLPKLAISFWSAVLVSVIFSVLLSGIGARARNS